jgi:hypothetical protein
VLRTLLGEHMMRVCVCMYVDMCVGGCVRMYIRLSAPNSTRRTYEICVCVCMYGVYVCI